jgi:adenine phosphoribosyltransferase
MAEDLKHYIRDVHDFPKKGIVFKDIAPLLWDPGAFRSSIERMAGFVARPDAVVAIESRGFIFGAGLALHWGVRFVAARKFGKLPGHTVREQYSLEYGEDVLELQADSLQRGHKAVIVDDLLATGGTAAATAKLVEQLGGSVEAMLFLVELDGLGGREALAGRNVHALVHYDLG